MTLGPPLNASCPKISSEVQSLADALAAREVEVAELRAEVENQRELRNEVDALRALINDMRRR